MQRGGQPQPGGQPGQQPQGQSAFNPDQNPFESIIADLQNKQPSQGGMEEAMGAAQEQGQPGGMPPGMKMSGGTPQLPTSQLEEGKNPSATKSLTQAISALQQFIAQSTDHDDIALGRNLIKLITRLIAKAEDAQLGNLEKGF